jgi:hypothetical protein
MRGAGWNLDLRSAGWNLSRAMPRLFRPSQKVAPGAPFNRRGTACRAPTGLLVGGACLLGGRSLSSDITMPLCLTTACAAPPAQSPPYDVVPKRELAPKLPNPNRSRYRLEFNISPTKQRTGVLSNRSKKWRFWEPKQPAGCQSSKKLADSKTERYIRQKQDAGRMPAVRRLNSSRITNHESQITSNASRPGLRRRCGLDRLRGGRIGRCGVALRRCGGNAHH